MFTKFSPVTHLLTVAVIIVFAFLMINWRTRNFDYQCEECGARFSLSFASAIMSFHMMGRKYVKCPHCGKWCWASPVPKE